jgi:hypothetical protein
LESHLFVRSAPDLLNIRTDPDPDTITVTGSVADPDPEGSETFGQIRPGTEINVSDPKKICKKEPYFQAEIRQFNTIIHISQEVAHCVVDP